MDERMRETLRVSRVFLLDNVVMKDLMDYMIEQDIFSDAMRERIMAGQTNREQIRKMLDELARRPHGCFEKFIVALRKSSQEHCADFVQSIYSKNILSQDPSIHATMSSPIQASSDVETSSSSQKPSYSLQYRGNNPEVTNYLIAGPCAALPDIIMEEPESFKAPVQESTFRQDLSSKDEYPMDTKPRGLALVINVEKFANMSRREGSVTDMNQLHDLLNYLGIKACYKTNCTADEIHEYLKAFSKHEELKNVSCLVVAVLSHGGKDGIIYGSDGNTLKDDDIRSYFSITECPLMENKPKLILIQACRGDQEDRVSQPTSISGSSLKRELGPSLDSNASNSSQRRADLSDICLIHSTVSGYVSYRHIRDGSPFIGVFCQQMKLHAANEHLTDIMIKVNNVLATSELQCEVRTLASSTNTLTRKWYFRPSDGFAPFLSQ
ncbi:caspase-2-like [Pomacea canaliculata]|uniref:caspase-2-like n=1 Tax=Pomacea canaliculata TaxID=400727 RepID=UPI000D73FB04|nr:caspase-2-like [Pomacea canaliculata]